MVLWYNKNDSIWINSQNAINHRYCTSKSKLLPCATGKKETYTHPFLIPAHGAVLYQELWLSCLVYIEWCWDLLPYLGELSPDSREKNTSRLQPLVCFATKRSLVMGPDLLCSWAWGPIWVRQAGRVKRDIELHDSKKSLSWYWGKHCGVLAWATTSVSWRPGVLAANSSHLLPFSKPLNDQNQA